MRSIPRASLRAALSLAGVAALAVNAAAQQDEAVQKTTAAAAPKPAVGIAPAALTPAPFGTIDIDHVMQNYDKFLATQERIQGEAFGEQQNLMKLGAEGKNLVEQLQRFKQGSDEYRKTTERINEVKAKLESKKEALQQEFEAKAAETMIATYLDIQSMAERVAKKYKMGYVVKVVRDPISPNDRQSAQAVIAQPLIYSDKSTDITQDVITYLNLAYKQSGGPQPKKAPAASGAASAPAAAPVPAAAAAPGAKIQR